MRYLADQFKKDVNLICRSGGLRDFYTIFEQDGSQDKLILNKNKFLNVCMKHKIKLTNVLTSNNKVEFEYKGKWSDKLTSNLFDVNDDIKRIDISHKNNNGYLELIKNVKL